MKHKAIVNKILLLMLLTCFFCTKRCRIHDLHNLPSDRYLTFVGTLIDIVREMRKLSELSSFFSLVRIKPNTVILGLIYHFPLLNFTPIFKEVEKYLTKPYTHQVWTVHSKIKHFTKLGQIPYNIFLKKS